MFYFLLSIQNIFEKENVIKTVFFHTSFLLATPAVYLSLSSSVAKLLHIISMIILFSVSLCHKTSFHKQWYFLFMVQRKLI